MGIHLYIEIIGLKGWSAMFFVVMRWYENMYVEWKMTVMNIFLYSNVFHDVCAYDHEIGYNVKVICVAKVVSKRCLVGLVIWDANSTFHKWTLGSTKVIPSL